MASEVLDPDLAAAIDHVHAGLELLVGAGFTPATASDALAVIRETERLGRQVDAVQVAVLDALDRSGLYKLDGHASAKVMVRHVARLSDLEASPRARALRALRDLPAVRAAYEAGKIGSCAVGLIALVHANPRVRAKFVELDADLSHAAAHRSHPELSMLLRNWESLTDQDGCGDRNQRHHQDRDAKLVQNFDTSWDLNANCGALIGAEMHSILKAFIDAEYRADWEHARAEWGDQAGQHLARTDAQRRFDALAAIFTKAAQVAATEAGGSAIVTNIVIDQDTFERVASQFAGATPEAPTFDLDPNPPPTQTHQPVEPADDEPADDEPADTTEPEPAPHTPTSPVGYRCSTLDGHPLDPYEVVAQALVGHIRRVVIGADSTVIDLGRRRRLFTGNAQLAARLTSTWCYWPGCHVPVTDCQTDHLTSWTQHHGRTHPGNGGPACGKHNRLKEHGYTVHRDKAGTFHVHRPDGTEID